jgi:hypothetical protein
MQRESSGVAQGLVEAGSEQMDRSRCSVQLPVNLKKRIELFHESVALYNAKVRGDSNQQNLGVQAEADPQRNSLKVTNTDASSNFPDLTKTRLSV